MGWFIHFLTSFQENFTLSNSRIKCLSILRTGSSYCYAQRWTALSQAFTSHQQPSEYLNCLNQKIFPSQLSAKLNKLFQLLLFYFLVSLIYSKFISGSNILALYKYFVHNTALTKNKLFKKIILNVFSPFESDFVLGLLSVIVN